jgi:hypothetical protein
VIESCNLEAFCHKGNIIVEKLFVNHEPLSLFDVGLSIFLPGVFSNHVLLSVDFDSIGNLKAFGHSLKHIEKSLFTGVFNQVDCWDGIVSCVIELS